MISGEKLVEADPAASSGCLVRTRRIVRSNLSRSLTGPITRVSGCSSTEH